ncbi:MAG: bifunctional DNA primase/polymerase, partial [bacterium]|nr:bifunctional DNA primase/polymerase [bacterium]
MNVNINPTVTGIGEYLKKYVDQGFKVFPCKLSDIPEKNKSPASINGFKDATDSIDTFYTLKENYSAITKQVIPDDKLLIGLATGNVNGIVVIDFDINKKIPGTKNIDPRTVDELIEEVEENYGPLPDTFTVETKSGGRHFYYLLPDGVELSSGNRFLDRLLSVDIKANGGYVIAPSGESGYIVYDDVDDLGIDNLRERCAPLPEWIEFHQRTQQEITQQVLNETLSPEEIREIRS